MPMMKLSDLRDFGVPHAILALPAVQACWTGKSRLQRVSPLECSGNGHCNHLGKCECNSHPGSDCSTPPSVVLPVLTSIFSFVLISFVFLFLTWSKDAGRRGCYAYN